MELFKIAIIDSGVDKTHPRLKECKIDGSTFLSKEQNVHVLSGVFEDNVGHGTAIAAIIHRIVPDVELVALKLAALGDTLSEDLLCEALSWCIRQDDIKVINISMGVVDVSPNSRLFNLCKKAFEKGIIISGSSHNMPGKVCYPAYFPFVFGVTSGHIKNKLDYGYIENSPINIIAKGTTQRIAWLNGSYKITSGNSYATAYFTGICAKMWIENPTAGFEEMQEIIKANAKKDIREIQYLPKGDSLDVAKDPPTEAEGEKMFCIQKDKSHVSRLALFPICEKEIGTILNFQSQCPFEITKYYDYPRRYSFAGLSKSDLPYPVIDRIIDSDFNEFETLVVGYFLDQMFDANILFGYKLIEKCIQQNKNFILLDKDFYNYIKQRLSLSKNSVYSGHIYIAYVDKNVYEQTLRYNYLPPVNVPVLLVVGTSNKQGKITTQMRLKKILTDEGYRISHVSTEPQGLLIGADYSFPFGYKATVSINEDVWGTFMNTVMKGVNYFNSPHIILTGTQGALIPRDKSNHSLYKKGSISAVHYMTGVLPDAIVCAINPEDTIELIRNVSDTIRIFSNAKILFYVMTPWMREYKKTKGNKVIASNRLLSKDEMQERMEVLQKELQLPVINIMDYSNDFFILECIEEAFTKKRDVC